MIILDKCNILRDHKPIIKKEKVMKLRSIRCHIISGMDMTGKE